MAFSCSYYQSSVVVLLSALLLSSTHGSQRTVVDPLLPVCKAVGGGAMSALGSDKRSRNAHGYRDLSAIAVDLFTENVTSTAVKIDCLLQSGGAGAGGTGLLSCQALYIEIVGRLPGCAAAVKSGSFKEAQASLRLSASDVNKCEARFVQSRVASPLKVEDDSAFKVAKLADGLLDLATRSS